MKRNNFVVQDAVPHNLAATLREGPLALAAWWDVALQLAQALAGLHATGAVHRHLSPETIIVDAATGAVTFAASGQASAGAALVYLAPEQTGRTGHVVDARSDLYALGVIYYELLTGAPPFTAHDPVELSHAHLARVPRPPDAIDARIPAVVSSIVLKLLEKEPERRYPGAAALAADLQEAQAQWRATGMVLPFPLAERDAPRQLAMPARLVGRCGDIDALYRAYDRVGKAPRELVLVAGAPGIGKSALVSQLEDYVAGCGGGFIGGKFDQLQRSMPYEGLVQAFRMLVRQLLTEPDAALAAWRERIQAAAAPNAQILVDVIPEIGSIIGPQAPVGLLGPIESRNRFHQVFTAFVRVFASPLHPLVLFLDDLQWVDAASLQLLQQWLTDAATGHLLVVGAYRDDEVGLAHPLALGLAELRQAGMQVTEVTLRPLDGSEVAVLIAATLELPVAACAPLAALVASKTAGNPFFIQRLLHALHVDGLLTFNAHTRAWEWDLDAIARAPVTDNVLDLMVDAIGRLPETARNLLQVGACIGHRFDLATLGRVTNHTPNDAVALLQPALQDGLLVQLPRTHTMQFVHDRVQQAAYTLLPEAQRSALHLDIGRHLLRGAAGDDLDARLFDVVHHLGRGAALMTEAAERIHLAELSLAAARKAKAAAAYQAAFDYLAIGRCQLPPDAWTALPALAFALHRELAECAYLTGRHADAEQELEVALAHAPDRIAQASLYSLRVLAATVAGDWAAALRWGRAGLAVFGHAWPLEGLAEATEAESLAVLKQVGDRPIADLADMPDVEDDETRACMNLLSVLGPPAYFSGSPVLTFLVTRGAMLSLLHGPSAYSAFAYVFYGALHNIRTGQYDVGYAFGKLALDLAQRFDNQVEQSRVLEVFGLVVHPWRAPVQGSLPLMRAGYLAGVASGELAFAAFNLSGLLINSLPAAVPLTQLLADADVSIAFATRHRNRTSVELSLPFRQFARVMMAPSRASIGFDDGQFNEARFLADAKDNQTAIGQYWVTRLQAAYLLGDLDAARAASSAGATSIQAGILGMITVAEHAFYTALTLTDTSGAVDEVQNIVAQFTVWAVHSPDNFRHKQLLIEAELARLTGAPWLAMERYGEAIAAATQGGFVQDAALANELAARLFFAHRQPQLADVYLKAALDGYRTWGALAKVAALSRTYGVVSIQSGPAPDTGMALDALGLIKATQAIAGETVVARLCERILQIVVQVAGAQAGTLLLGDTSSLHVRARITADDGTAVTLEDTPLNDCPQLPRAIIRYVARTRAPLVLVDAALDDRFAVDAEVRALGLRSVLCVPLTKLGMLYLENKAMAGAFTLARVEVVQALAAQAAISLENSSLLAERARTEHELRQLATDLSDENRRKTEFLATLAHELRNPLAPIRTGLDLMRLGGNSTPAAARVHDMMGRQLNQMVHLIDDLLDIARINSGKVQLKKERVALGDAISSAVEAALPAIKAAQQTLDLDIPDGPIMLHADPTRLAQVFSNLLTNATKYTPRGGHITVRVQVAGEGVDIAVTDTGLGIPADALLEVFDMFNQVSRNMGRSQGGLGIGLSLVRSLVQMHGGVVGAASPGEGQGSTFTVHLPLAAPAAEDGAQPGVPGETAAAPARRLRVLVADDNVDAANMLLALLDMSGHDVALAHDGRQALEQAQGGGFDLAILDIGMPGLSGYQVAEAIRRLPDGDQVYLAALTGWGAEEDRNRSKQAGFQSHLTKPAAIAEIHAVLAAALAAAQKG